MFLFQWNVFQHSKGESFNPPVVPTSVATGFDYHALFFSIQSRRSRSLSSARARALHKIYEFYPTHRLLVLLKYNIPILLGKRLSYFRSQKLFSWLTKIQESPPRQSVHNPILLHTKKTDCLWTKKEQALYFTKLSIEFTSLLEKIH